METNFFLTKRQKGVISPIIALAGLGIILVGIVFGRQLVENATRSRTRAFAAVDDPQPEFSTVIPPTTNTGKTIQELCRLKGTEWNCVAGCPYPPGSGSNQAYLCANCQSGWTTFDTDCSYIVPTTATYLSACCYNQPIVSPSVTPELISPTPTCYPKPPCVDGIIDPVTKEIRYCDPQPGTIFCPDTPTPSVTPELISPTPTIAMPACPAPISPCPQTKGKGDADCNGKIEECDYKIWFEEFIVRQSTKNADFNNDSKVDMIDFEIWRRNNSW